MDLLIQVHGTVLAVYGEELPLNRLGRLTIRRGSHVEPDESGRWQVDLSPVNGPMLGPFPRRSAALAAEQRWLSRYWLLQQDQSTTSD